MVITIRLLPGADDDQTAFAAIVALYQADAAVRDPDDSPPSAAEVRAELFSHAPDQVGFVLLAEVDDVAVGMAWAKSESEPDDDLQLSSAEVFVSAHRRRQGIGTALARAMIVPLQERGQHSVLGFVCAEIEPAASRALCEKFGLTERQEERCSRVRVSDIDRSLLATWEADAVTWAPGYRLEQWQGFCPPELAEAWSIAAAGMEDAPLDGVEHHPFTRDAESQRAADAVYVDAGFKLYRSLVLGPDGDPAGLSVIYVHQDRPELGHQGDTAVLAAHRGHRIGKWLKAANFRLAAAAHPEIVVIQTYNAQSNPWMLDINIAMGFRPHHYYKAFQGSLEEAARRL